MRRLTLILVLLAAAFAAGGCSVSGDYAPMTIEVRDARTLAPIAGALVEARAMHLALPVEPGVYYRPFPDTPRSARGRTDDTGAVRLDVVVNHGVQVLVAAPGYETQAVELERHPKLWRPETTPAWLDPDFPPDPLVDARRIQVRFRP